MQEATVAVFLHSKLDGVFAVRSCPLNSWTQEIERIMSWLNFSLYDQTLNRPKLDNERFKSMAVIGE